MDREQKISILQKIANGEASPESLRPKHLVHRIFAPNNGKQSGLYCNNVLSTDLADAAEFSKAFASGEVHFFRVHTDGTRTKI